MSFASEPMNVEMNGPNPWLAIIVIGVLSGLLGLWMTISAIAGTDFSPGVIAALLAIGMFLNGFAELAWAPDRSSPVIGYVLGALFLLAGVAVLMNPILGLSVLAAILGISLIIVGLAQTVIAFSSRDEIRHWATLAVFGVLTIAIGIAAVVWPNATVRVIALLFGIRLLIVALGTVSVGMTFKKLA